MDPFHKTRTYILPVRVHAHTKPDCGNAKFAHAGRRGGRFACSLQRERDDTNAGNAYNHNFKDQWCYCDGLEALPMVQCLGCKDWYHQVGGCIHTHYNFDRDDFAEEDFLCQTCLDAPALAFLHQYPAKPLADRPAWQPHAPQTPATPASGPGPGGPLVSPSPSSSPPSAAADAAISSPPAAAMAVAEEGKGPEEDCCAVCYRPPVAGAPACLSSFVTCTGRRPPAVGEAEAEAEGDDRKPSAQDAQEQEQQEEEAMGGGACGRRYHPCCLPRGAAGVRDADGCVVGIPSYRFFS